MDQEGEAVAVTEQNGKLVEIGRAEETELVRSWRAIVRSGDGPRGGMPDRPDDAVAYKLLEAAGDAIGRGSIRQGVNILRLVTRDFRQSKEAAFARTVLDELPKTPER